MSPIERSVKYYKEKSFKHNENNQLKRQLNDRKLNSRNKINLINSGINIFVMIRAIK